MAHSTERVNIQNGMQDRQALTYIAWPSMNEKSSFVYSRHKGQLIEIFPFAVVQSCIQFVSLHIY